MYKIYSLRTEKTLGLFSGFFCLLKGSRKVMIQSVLSSLFKEINFMKKDRKS
ncbi:hypothetical protein EMIT0180MI3_21242 [Priestia megaterium]|jgi:hypothetical protein